MIDFAPSTMVALLWLIPLLPLVAAAVISLLPARSGELAGRLACGAQGASAVLALLALLTCLGDGREKLVASAHPWIQADGLQIPVGLMLDPIGAAMTAMVAFVAFWIFLYSTAYMKDEPRRVRFFAYLCLFSGAMLLLVLANSLLLLFMAWELVGLASYLLIGFYFSKPAAAAAAQKAFLTTRVGDLLFFLGMLWLHAESGTLLFHDSGRGLLESGVLHSLAGVTTAGGLAVSTGATLLLLGGAMGKSGQFPLHGWLPDAMEGPTPVSALIHAATMVAAGVFMVARLHPVFSAATDPNGLNAALTATAWVGGITAVFAALCATAQSDIKRLLAWSTISQLGFMMIALGTGGVAAAMFHLIAHAFFKALLFLSAGSVIHGCGGEQDTRNMGGLRDKMPRTFYVYAIGMMALAGFPFLFSGFWSKEAILHSAVHWKGGYGPFMLAAGAAILTASYMTRQALDIFFGQPRGQAAGHAHESPPVMLVPMAVLASGAVLLSLLGTPVWPWFEAWVNGHPAEWKFSALWSPGTLGLIGLSLVLVAIGTGHAWWTWKSPRPSSTGTWRKLRESGFQWDMVQEKLLAPATDLMARGCDRLDRWFFLPLLSFAAGALRFIGKGSGVVDEGGFNTGFDHGCAGIAAGGNLAAKRRFSPQAPLRAMGILTTVLFLLFLWLRA